MGWLNINGIWIGRNRGGGISGQTYWTTLTSGLIMYRKGIRSGNYVIDYSADGGVTWELNLVVLEPDEDTIIINIDDGEVGYRHEIRGDAYCIDAELTATGFDGIRGSDWENIFIIGSEYTLIKYRDGSDIPIVTDDGAWAALETGAMCYYNNDINNALM